MLGAFPRVVMCLGGGGGGCAFPRVVLGVIVSVIETVLSGVSVPAPPTGYKR